MQKEAVLAWAGLCVKPAHRTVALVHFEQVGPELTTFHPTLSSLRKRDIITLSLLLVRRMPVRWFVCALKVHGGSSGIPLCPAMKQMFFYCALVS